MCGRRSAGWAPVLLAVAVVAAACSGGGSGADGDDLQLGRGELALQFEGSADLRLGGTLAVPDQEGSGPVPAVLIVPAVARNDRNGYVDVVPADPVYQDLSRAITRAGMAAFRYDRRSMGTSKLEDGDPLSFDDMVTDARRALLFLSQRSGIDGSNLAVVGHDMGGVIAMRVAAGDDRVKSVVLLSTPGRPLVDVMASSFDASNGQESGDAFRAVIDTLLSSGALPERSAIRPEHQPVLPLGQDAVLRQMYAADPVADAAAVKAPTLVVSGSRSPLVGGVDGERLTAALSSAEAFTADTNATLQHLTAPLPQASDPNDHRAHGGGRPPETATRNQAAVDRIAAFLGGRLGGARP